MTGSAWYKPALIAGLLLATTNVASAQDLPYDNYRVGDRALGLGGAFVGLSDDASATFHNPAGLAFIDRTSISTSFWLMAYTRSKVDGGWQTDEGIADLTDENLSSPPLVATAVAKVGKRDRYGKRRHSLGLAVLKPLRRKYRYAVLLDDPARLSSLDVSHSDQARWYGASYAYGRCGWAFGITGFVSLRSLYHEEVEIHGQTGPDGHTPPGYEVTRHSVFEASMTHVVLRLGGMWQVTPRVRIGVMLQPPVTGVSSSAANREVTFDIAEDGSTAIDHVQHTGMTARRPIPAELRVGATWFVGKRSLITGDLTVHGGAGSAREPIELVSDETLPRPRLLSLETYLRPSIRAAIGGEVMLGKRWPLRGGALMYRSGLPNISPQATQPATRDMQTVGASISLGRIMGDGHELSFGAAGTYSWGDATALDQTTPMGATYVATDVEEFTVFVFVSGGTRVVKRLAKRLAREGRDLIRKGGDWLRESQ